MILFSPRQVGFCSQRRFSAEAGETLLEWLLFRLDGDSVALLLEAFEHGNPVAGVIVDKTAIPVFKGGKQCVSAILVIGLFGTE